MCVQEKQTFFVSNFRSSVVAQAVGFLLLLVLSACDPAGPGMKVSEKYRRAVYVVAIGGKKDPSTQNSYRLKFRKPFSVPGTQMVLTVQNFFPSFSYSGKKKQIESSSDELNNPAIFLVCRIKGKVQYRDWIFKRFPKFGNNNNFSVNFQFKEIEVKEK